MESFSMMFGETEGFAEAKPTTEPPEGLLWDWRQVSDGAFAWRLVPAGDSTSDPFRSYSYYVRQFIGELRASLCQPTATDAELRRDAEDAVRWIGTTWAACKTAENPLAAMCNHKDTHSTERLPESTAKEAPAGINTVAGFDHRPGAWK